MLQVLGRIPERGDIAEVPVPDGSDDEESRERLVTLTVEHMDGLRIDRVALNVLDGPGRQTGEER